MEQKCGTPFCESHRPIRVPVHNTACLILGEISGSHGGEFFDG
jgi:hypothetical protein